MLCLFSLSLWGCKSEEEKILLQKQAFHHTLDSLYPELREGLYRQTKLAYFNKSDYSHAVLVLMPKTYAQLKPFREDYRTVRLASWMALHKALEHYRMADFLWKNQRGISLVMNRIREANRLMDAIPKAYEEETGGARLLQKATPEEAKSTGGTSEKKGGHG